MNKTYKGLKFRKSDDFQKSYLARVFEYENVCDLFSKFKPRNIAFELFEFCPGITPQVCQWFNYSVRLGLGNSMREPGDPASCQNCSSNTRFCLVVFVLGY